MKQLKLVLAASFLTLFLGINTLTAQVDKASIEKRLEAWFDATNSGQWGTLLDMTYDKLFEQVPRQQMEQVFDQMKAMGMEMSVDKYEVNNIGTAIDNENTNFVIVGLSTTENIKLTGSQFQGDQVISMMKQQFAATYGEGNVEYTKEDNSFKLTGNKTLVAIAPNGSTEWKFMEYNKANPMQAQMVKNILPENVLSELEK